MWMLVRRYLPQWMWAYALTLMWLMMLHVGFEARTAPDRWAVYREFGPAKWADLRTSLSTDPGGAYLYAIVDPLVDDIQAIAWWSFQHKALFETHPWILPTLRLAHGVLILVLLFGGLAIYYRRQGLDPNIVYRAGGMG